MDLFPSRVHLSGFWIRNRRIPDSTSKDFLDSGFLAQIFPVFRNPDYLRSSDTYTHTVIRLHNRENKVFKKLAKQKMYFLS